MARRTQEEEEEEEEAAAEVKAKKGNASRVYLAGVGFIAQWIVWCGGIGGGDKL